MTADQRSTEWLFERAGKATASRFVDVLAKLKSGAPAKARQDYLWELVVERVKEGPTDHYTSTPMQWGEDNEAPGRMLYEARTGAFVELVGFVPHPTIANCGGSPDGLVSDDGCIEIKCPWNSAIHLQTILDGMPPDHMPQVQGCMAINDRAWCDFISFDPRLREDKRIYIQRIQRDDAYIAALEGELTVFLSEVDAMMARLA